MKRLTFEIYILFVSIFFYSFNLGSKNKNIFGEINILDCISSHQVMVMSLTKVWVIVQNTEYRGDNLRHNSDLVNT